MDLIMRAGIVLAAVGLLAGTSPARESTPVYEIRGIVVESGSGQPLADVEVTLQPSGNPENIRTDLTGAFRFSVNEPGRYALAARKPGYVPAGPASKVFAQYHFDLSKEKPRAVVKIPMAMPCGLTGRIVDAESKRPVAGVVVRVYGTEYRDGALRLSPIDPVSTTKADGLFRIAGLPPGDYLVETEQNRNAAQRVRSDFDEGDLNRRTLSYLRTYWPGGTDAESAHPLPLASGNVLDLGDLPVSLRPAYHVRGKPNAPNCAPGTALAVTLFQSINGVHTIRAQGRTSCGGEFLIEGLERGRFEIGVFTRKDGAEAFGYTEVEISNRNVDVTIDVQPGFEAAGKVSMEGRELPPGLRVGVKPAGGFYSALSPPAPISAGGTFILRNLRAGIHELRMAVLPPRVYIREVRYNGRAVPPWALPLDAFALHHSLEIDLGDQPAALKGRVVDRDTPVVNASVVLVPWPGSARSLYANRRLTQTGGDGAFEFPPLPPGEYRLFAVPEFYAERLEAPGVLEGFVRDGRKVKLGENEQVSFTLTPAALP